MIPFPQHLDLLQQQPRPQTTMERELAAIEARVARRSSREPLLKRFALRRLFGSGPAPATAGEITIRQATDADRPALERLADLDRRPLPEGVALVAEVDRRIVAGVSLATAEPVADPFRARRDVVQLLQVRAAQLAA
jgi:hypothetical protein